MRVGRGNGGLMMGTAAMIVLAHPSLPLLDQVDLWRLEASRRLDPKRRSEFGQFLTPSPIAAFMASLFCRFHAEVRLLDAGAGAGALLAAATLEAIGRDEPPQKIRATGYEIDPTLATYLRQTTQALATTCRQHGVAFSSEVIDQDFIEGAVEALDGGLFRRNAEAGFTHAILNPPYRKLNSDSVARLYLRRAGIETSNLYTAFVALAIQRLAEGGEIVAITPRSFCNGPYFRPFRQFVLEATAIQRIHVFESRTAAFSDDEVLQENVIFHLVKGGLQGTVTVSSNSSPDDELLSVREVPFEQIVRPGDRDLFIHLVPDEGGQQLSDAFAKLPCKLPELGLTVSTGKVVDFRAKEFLRSSPASNTGPLIYPTHFLDGRIQWPKLGKKPNALVACSDTAELWMPSGTYVLVKRFSSKEEPRRVVAAIFDPADVPGSKIGFENHLNVFHAAGHGCDPALARGLAAYLNSTVVDTYFRQFNGHTQVNATDLRNLRYPSREALVELGKRLGAHPVSPEELDQAVVDVVGLGLMEDPSRRRKIDEALEVLRELGLPRQQQNDRSALTLLALLDLKPEGSWSKAASPMMGITPIMDFAKDHYGKAYAPNTRETFRRQTVHQFRDAGLILANPDDPARAVNSPKAVYQIEARALELLRSFGTPAWKKKLLTYVAQAGTLAGRYAQARDMAKLPVTLPDGHILKLTPGGQNELVKQIVEEFCPVFAPGGRLLYVGDTGDKFALFDQTGLAKLGVEMDSHGKMPDLVVHRTDKNWLLLIEAVTSHGPVNPKRLAELSHLFAKSTAGLVFVTAFLTRKDMLKYLGDISWETEVWVAESPEHMIHFNGERFLGPYSK